TGPSTALSLGTSRIAVRPPRVGSSSRGSTSTAYSAAIAGSPRNRAARLPVHWARRATSRACPRSAATSDACCCQMPRGPSNVAADSTRLPGSADPAHSQASNCRFSWLRNVSVAMSMVPPMTSAMVLNVSAPPVPARARMRPCMFKNSSLAACVASDAVGLVPVYKPSFLSCSSRRPRVSATHASTLPAWSTS
ncbi:MAG: hypothetical protein Q6365_019510, partial [Candidatus Sigynarchaeota archaeon]